MIFQLNRCSLDQGGGLLRYPNPWNKKKLFEPFSNESIFKALKRVILISHISYLRNHFQEMDSRLEFRVVNILKEKEGLREDKLLLIETGINISNKGCQLEFLYK